MPSWPWFDPVPAYLLSVEFFLDGFERNLVMDLNFKHGFGLKNMGLDFDHVTFKARLVIFPIYIINYAN